MRNTAPQSTRTPRAQTADHATKTPKAARNDPHEPPNQVVSTLQATHGGEWIEAADLRKLAMELLGGEVPPVATFGQQKARAQRDLVVDVKGVDYLDARVLQVLLPSLPGSAGSEASCASCTRLKNYIAGLNTEGRSTCSIG